MTASDTSYPYYAQWESRELVGAILRGELLARDDPAWANSGAASAEEYEFWSWRACGMACLKTILCSRRDEPAGIVALAKEVLEAGGYTLGPGGLNGLIYRPFVDYLEARWQIAAEVRPSLTMASLRAELASGAIAMASVHSSIRTAPASPRGRGGHLVLALGLEGGDIVFHNPSGDNEATQSHVQLAAAVFDRYFAHRGIVVRAAT